MRELLFMANTSSTESIELESTAISQTIASSSDEDKDFGHAYHTSAKCPFSRIPFPLVDSLLPKAGSSTIDRLRELTIRKVFDEWKPERRYIERQGTSKSEKCTRAFKHGLHQTDSDLYQDSSSITLNRILRRRVFPCFTLERSSSI